MAPLCKLSLLGLLLSSQPVISRFDGHRIIQLAVLVLLESHLAETDLLPVGDFEDLLLKLLIAH